MAFPTNIAVEVTKAATGGDETGVALGSAVATSNLMITTSNALGLAAHNATNQQQQSFLALHATTLQLVWNIRQDPPAPMKVFA